MAINGRGAGSRRRGRIEEAFEVYERIMVPLDGSEFAERALPPAEELARLTGAPLHLIRIVDVASQARYSAYGLAIEAAALAQVLDEEVEVARDYLDRLEQQVAARGLSVVVEVRSGVPVQEIVAAARPNDLVVMATHGRGGVARWFLGSVAEAVVRRAPAPVLLVRAVAHDHADEAEAMATAVEA